MYRGLLCSTYKKLAFFSKTLNFMRTFENWFKSTKMRFCSISQCHSTHAKSRPWHEEERKLRISHLHKYAGWEAVRSNDTEGIPSSHHRKGQVHSPIDMNECF